MLLLEASSCLHLPLIISLLGLHPGGSWVGPWFSKGTLLLGLLRRNTPFDLWHLVIHLDWAQSNEQ